MSKQGDLRFTQQMVEARVKRALRKKEKAFVRVHAHDSDAELIEYLRLEAKRLHHSPCACEIVGGKYITERFGTWENALTAADLPLPKKKPSYGSMAIVKAERKRQWTLRAQRNAHEKKEASATIVCAAQSGE